MSHPSVMILGAGRMGQGLALALTHAGHPVTLVARRRHDVIRPLTLFAGERRFAVESATVVLLAVPDEAIAPLAHELARDGGFTPSHAVLHLSGLRDHTALEPLVSTGAARGSLHPLQTVSDPSQAVERFAGAYAGIEGTNEAVRVAEMLARGLGMTPVRIPAGAKPLYHAGAAFAANYTTALVAVAERLARTAGIAPEVARQLYLPLVRGAAANLESGPVAALTGPVRRGDAETVRVHLAALAGDDRRLYRLVALEALRLAREAGLDPAAANRVQDALAETFEPVHPY